MRETGETDESLANLVEVHFENELRTQREVGDFLLTFGSKIMTIDDADENNITSISGDFYIAAIRAALQVPLPFALGSKKKTDKKPVKKAKKK